MKFTIQSPEFEAIVRNVDAEMEDLQQQVRAVSERVDDVQGVAIHTGLRDALTRLRDDFTVPVGASAVAWAEAVVKEGGNVAVSYRDFDDEAARRADEAEVA